MRYRRAEFQLGQMGREASGLSYRHASGAAEKLDVFKSAMSVYDRLNLSDYEAGRIHHYIPLHS